MSSRQGEAGGGARSTDRGGARGAQLWSAAAQYGHFFHAGFTGFWQFGHLSATAAGEAAAGIAGGEGVEGSGAGATPGTGLPHFGHLLQFGLRLVPQTRHEV